MGHGLKHHETTQAFIRALEFLAPSVHSVQAMRAHIVFTSFERRWQLPVYFQLRWKEIVVKLEDSFVTAKLERNKGVYFPTSEDCGLLVNRVAQRLHRSSHRKLPLSATLFGRVGARRSTSRN